MKVEYNSNNSGGYWWLSDADWYALEEAGWDVEWVKDTDHFESFRHGGRFLGALATSATKEFDSIEEAVEDWENITGYDASDPGCSCCGPPHYFLEV